MDKNTAQLGHAVRDIVTGQTGIITGILIQLNGCFRVSLQPVMMPDGTRPDEQWINAEQIQYVGEGVRPEILEQTKEYARQRLAFASEGLDAVSKN